MKRINIAIDGYSACGKSTLAKDLATRLEYRHVDSGSMYRAITDYFLQEGVDFKDQDQIAATLTQIKLDFVLLNNISILTMNEVKQGDNLRTPQIDKNVSTVAAMAQVRTKVVGQQQQIGRAKGVVMDGRDIGSVVYPRAELKIFLEADLDVRVARRYEELQAKGINSDLNTIKANLKHRDHIDSTREHSPLVKTKDAVLVDNSNLSRQEQLEMMVVLAYSRMR